MLQAGKTATRPRQAFRLSDECKARKHRHRWLVYRRLAKVEERTSPTVLWALLRLTPSVVVIKTGVAWKGSGGGCFISLALGLVSVTSQE